MPQEESDAVDADPMLTVVNSGEQSMTAWLDQVADHTPTPGGGAVAAVLAAMSAALLSMVANYTTGPKYADPEPRMAEMLTELAALRTTAMRLADDDVEAFAMVAAAYKLPRSTDEEKQARTAGIQAALRTAAGPPTEVGWVAATLVELAEELAEHGNVNVISDVAVASATARAALESAVLNIDINRFQIRDEREKARLSTVVERLRNAVAHADAVTAAVKASMC
jgi:methenyltetrahydrofolate cyclohydrolase